MLGGLPVEMITMLGSSLLGGVMSMWSQATKNKQDQQKMLLARDKFQNVRS
jgi:predicted phage tail protein